MNLAHGLQDFRVRSTLSKASELRRWYLHNLAIHHEQQS